MKIKIAMGVLIILTLVVAFFVITFNKSGMHFRATKDGVEVKMTGLTIEWLDENCRLIDFDKFSCPDNYIVEFWEQGE